MQLNGQRVLPVTQQQAWDALNNPEVLKACIPGCEKLESAGENAFAAVTAIKIGPVSARFTGKLNLSNITPPHSYHLAFEGQGGGAGFGKGASQVTLTPQAGDTLLAYTVDAQVGGKIAQLGQRLIDGVAKTMADDFFKRFEAQLLALHPEAATSKIIAENVINTLTPGQNLIKNVLRDLTSPPWTYLAGAGVGAALMVGVLWLASR